MTGCWHDEPDSFPPILLPNSLLLLWRVAPWQDDLLQVPARSVTHASKSKTFLAKGQCPPIRLLFGCMWPLVRKDKAFASHIVLFKATENNGVRSMHTIVAALATF